MCQVRSKQLLSVAEIEESIARNTSQFHALHKLANTYQRLLQGFFGTFLSRKLHKIHNSLNKWEYDDTVVPTKAEGVTVEINFIS